jgi:hypothetical protein
VRELPRPGAASRMAAIKTSSERSERPAEWPPSKPVVSEANGQHRGWLISSHSRLCARRFQRVATQYNDGACQVTPSFVRVNRPRSARRSPGVPRRRFVASARTVPGKDEMTQVRCLLRSRYCSSERSACCEPRTRALGSLTCERRSSLTAPRKHGHSGHEAVSRPRASGWRECAPAMSPMMTRPCVLLVGGLIARAGSVAIGSSFG